MERVGMGKLSQGTIPTWAFSALFQLGLPSAMLRPLRSIYCKSRPWLHLESVNG